MGWGEPCGPSRGDLADIARGHAEAHGMLDDPVREAQDLQAGREMAHPRTAEEAHATLLTALRGRAVVELEELLAWQLATPDRRRSMIRPMVSRQTVETCLRVLKEG